MIRRLNPVRQISPTKSAPITTSHGNDNFSEYLEPLKNPKKEIELILASLNNQKTHWEEVISSIETVRKLAMHHQEIMLPKAGEVTSLVIRQCQNGRSKVNYPFQSNFI